jgi:hypothetical protein
MSSPCTDITVESSTINRDFIVAVGSVSQWEYLLQTEFSVFRHLFAYALVFS